MAVCDSASRLGSSVLVGLMDGVADGVAGGDADGEELGATEGSSVSEGLAEGVAVGLDEVASGEKTSPASLDGESGIDPVLRVLDSVDEDADSSPVAAALESGVCESVGEEDASGEGDAGADGASALELGSGVCDAEGVGSASVSTQGVIVLSEEAVMPASDSSRSAESAAAEGAEPINEVSIRSAAATSPTRR